MRALMSGVLCSVLLFTGCKGGVPHGKGAKTSGVVLEIVGTTAVGVGATTVTAAAIAAAGEGEGDTCTDFAAAGAATAVAGALLYIAGSSLTAAAHGAQEKLETKREQAREAERQNPVCKRRRDEAVQAVIDTAPKCNAVCGNVDVPELERVLNDAEALAAFSKRAAEADPANSALQTAWLTAEKGMHVAERDLDRCQAHIDCAKHASALKAIEDNAWCAR